MQYIDVQPHILFIIFNGFELRKKASDTKNLFTKKVFFFLTLIQVFINCLEQLSIRTDGDIALSQWVLADF